MRVGGQRHGPAALPPGKTRYPFYRMPVGPRGRSGRVRKISPPPGFDPRTVQPVGSRYTDYAIPAPSVRHMINKITGPEKKRSESLNFLEIFRPQNSCLLT